VRVATAEKAAADVKAQAKADVAVAKRDADARVREAEKRGGVNAARVETELERVKAERDRLAAELASVRVVATRELAGMVERLVLRAVAAETKLDETERAMAMLVPQDAPAPPPMLPPTPVVENDDADVRAAPLYAELQRLVTTTGKTWAEIAEAIAHKRRVSLVGVLCNKRGQYTGARYELWWTLCRGIQRPYESSYVAGVWGIDYRTVNNGIRLHAERLEAERVARAATA
jgi:hypothetical protein